MDPQLSPTIKLVLTDSPSDLPSFPEGEEELGFRFDGLSALNPQIQIGSTLVADHLAHAIAASPSDLLRHTQRIYFFYERWDSDGLYSALLDLFIALGNKGSVLRKRLLNGARDRLLPEHSAALSRWLEHGPPDGEKDLPPAEHSILSKGIVGVRELVRVVQAPKDTSRDPLLEAREYIEYFQIEEARSLLEAAILEQPEREELHTELVHLYEATRDTSGLQAMREKLSQIMPELPECWLPSGMPPHGGENP